MTAIDLTPAEALVLLDPTIKQGRNPFKLSLMWLLAQKHLVAGEERVGWFRTRTTRLRPGPRAGQPLSPDLQAVMETVRDAPTGLMDDVVKAAVERYGPNLLGFQTGVVYPALRRRGLIRMVNETYLYFFIRECWQHTTAGKALSQRVESLMEDARRIPGYLDRNPAQAAALVATLGGLILLLPELRPHLEDIAGVMRRPPYSDSGSSTSSDGGGPSTDAEHDAGFSHTPEFDYDLGDFDLGNLDGLDASLSALDSSFDASSDSAGGDGGGGDGGGGGD